MSVELEREYTFLIHNLPEDLNQFPSKIVEDNFIPQSSDHPKIRIRRNGDSLVITKKHPENGDSSRMVEHTIELSPEEYAALNQLRGKRFKKRRYAYETNGYAAEIDIYLGDLVGLVVIDFEFTSDEAMSAFSKPTFAGAEITHDDSLAGGTLCGKAYSDIAEHLASQYGYQPVTDVDKYEEELASN